MATKKLLYHRRFLNEGSGTALIETSVEVTGTEDGEYPWMTATVTLADCSRQISLEFGYCMDETGDDSYGARMRKINALLTDLHAFRDALIASKKPFDKAVAGYKKARDERKKKAKDAPTVVKPFKL